MAGRILSPALSSIFNGGEGDDAQVLRFHVKKTKAFSAFVGV
jgi:hypothetical protein